MLSAIAALAAVVTSQPGTGVTPEGAAWVKSHAVALKSCVAGSGFEDLGALREIVGDARIVALGEPTHGTREAFQMKHRLLEYLATEMGFRVFSIEANMPESYALNGYVVEGKGDPAKLIAGMYFWTWRTEEVLAMVEWMKTFNEAGRAREGEGFVPLRFTGFDMQTPDVAGAIAVDGVRAVDGALADEMAAAYAQLPALQRQSAGVRSNGGTTAIMVGTFPAEAAKGKKVKVGAWIRTKDVGTFAGWWFRCDNAEQKPVAFNNMAEFGPKGTAEWKHYEFTLDAPADTVNINFGPIVIGGGDAWFDDVEIELDGVKFSDPQKFSFDFENPAVKFLTLTTPGATVKRVDEGAHGGATCLFVSAPAKAAEEPEIDGAELEGTTARLASKLIGMREQLAARHGKDQADWIIQNGTVVAQCAQMLAAGAMGGAVRDESMAANIKWILDRDPRSKIVLWAHNGHVSRAAFYGQTWMGGHLERAFPGEMVVFGFATGSGLYTAIKSNAGLVNDNALAPAPAGSVEAHLASAGLPQLLLDIRPTARDNPDNAWAAKPTMMRSIGALATEQQFYPLNARESFDVLVYIDATTASRTLK